MAMHARPVPKNPYNPSGDVNGRSASPSSNDASDSQIRYPSPFIPIRLPIFAPVLWLNDRVVSLLSFLGGPRARPMNSLEKEGARRPRALSDSTVESAEEGVDTTGVYDATGTAKNARTRERERFRVGRRKLD